MTEQSASPSPGSVINGDRVDVTFSFYSGAAGLVRRADTQAATVAYRGASIPYKFDPAGKVDGQDVLILAVNKSPMSNGFIRVDVRFLEAPKGGE